MRERVSAGRAVAAEAVGTAMLLCAVVGSGIMGDRLSGGSVGLALLANSLATGAALFCLIAAFGPISGAHFNPVVTLGDAAQRGLPWKRVMAYLAAQLSGACAGVMATHAMFGEPLVMISQRDRSGGAQMLSESIATFGLLTVIWGCSRRRGWLTPFAVAAYITAAYWFTSSTSFANPAVTIARSMTDTFTGIRPGDVPGFVIAQLAGAAVATLLFRWLVPAPPSGAADVVTPLQYRGVE